MEDTLSIEPVRKPQASFKKTYGTPITLPALADRLGQYVQAHTLYNSVRPFGITAIVGGVDENGAHLYMLEPSGSYWGYKGAATGKGRQSAKAELEKILSSKPDISAKEAVKEAARVVYLAHDDNKEKEFELEMSWCSVSETNGLHKAVPKDLLDEAIAYAKVESGDGSDSDDSSDDSENENEQEKKDAEGDVHLE